ncbi:hypothetical protein AVEN_46585-1 [Araneus ventricosus]|uniref:Uncharacterized protein n=1 Tax=Araneus ventricosus TaxID=182803 RepID=A0A4Y2MMZ9_ARAVE|nr:hypothetical protein AVEN_46585-1 [Araneus ventricosus]
MPSTSSSAAIWKILQKTKAHGLAAQSKANQTIDKISMRMDQLLKNISDPSKPWRHENVGAICGPKAEIHATKYGNLLHEDHK